MVIKPDVNATIRAIVTAKKPLRVLIISLQYSFYMKLSSEKYPNQCIEAWSSYDVQKNYLFNETTPLTIQTTISK